MTERAFPDPLVPPEVDLRDFAFMPLDVVRLRDSGLAAKASGDEFRAAVLLWCASWHQRPAASLPDDDDELANLCGYGRARKEWAKVRAGALRGWTKCADGRLYHETVAIKAREAWQSKLAQRARTEAARKAREEQRQKQSQPLSQTSQSSVTEHVTESKGQGQGQGQGLNTSEAKASGATAPPADLFADKSPKTDGDPPDAADTIFALGVPLLTASGVSDRNARSMLGLLRKTNPDEAVIGVLQRCAAEKPLQPVPWLQNALKAAAPGLSSKPDRIAQANIAVARKFHERTAQ